MKRNLYYFKKGINNMRDNIPIMEYDMLEQFLNRFMWDANGLLPHDKLKDLDKDFYVNRPGEDGKQHYAIGYLLRRNTKFSGYIPDFLKEEEATVLELVEFIEDMTERVMFYRNLDNYNKFLEKHKNDEDDKEFDIDYFLMKWYVNDIKDSLERNHEYKEKGIIKPFWEKSAFTRTRLFKDNRFGMPDLINLYSYMDDEYLSDLIDNYALSTYWFMPMAFNIFQNIDEYHNHGILYTIDKEIDEVINYDLEKFSLNGMYNRLLFLPAKTNLLEDDEAEYFEGREQDKFISLMGNYDSIEDYENFYKIIDEKKNPELRESTKKLIEKKKYKIIPYLKIFNVFYNCLRKFDYEDEIKEKYKDEDR